MNKEVRIHQLAARIRLLESRGPHNTKICNKLRRQIRKLEKEIEV